MPVGPSFSSRTAWAASRSPGGRQWSARPSAARWWARCLSRRRKSMWRRSTSVSRRSRQRRSSRCHSRPLSRRAGTSPMCRSHRARRLALFWGAQFAGRGFGGAYQCRVRAWPLGIRPVPAEPPDRAGAVDPRGRGAAAVPDRYRQCATGAEDRARLSIQIAPPLWRRVGVVAMRSIAKRSASRRRCSPPQPLGRVTCLCRA